MPGRWLWASNTRFKETVKNGTGGLENRAARAVFRFARDVATKMMLSQARHVDGLFALLAIDNLEGNLLTLGQSLESSSLDIFVMNKNVITLALLNESEALLLIKPLHHALNTHTEFSL